MSLDSTEDDLGDLGSDSGEGSVVFSDEDEDIADLLGGSAAPAPAAAPGAAAGAGAGALAGDLDSTDETSLDTSALGASAVARASAVAASSAPAQAPATVASHVVAGNAASSPHSSPRLVPSQSPAGKWGSGSWKSGIQDLSLSSSDSPSKPAAASASKSPSKAVSALEPTPEGTSTDAGGGGGGRGGEGASAGVEDDVSLGSDVELVDHDDLGDDLDSVGKDDHEPGADDSASATTKAAAAGAAAAAATAGADSGDSKAGDGASDSDALEPLDDEEEDIDLSPSKSWRAEHSGGAVLDPDASVSASGSASASASESQSGGGDRVADVGAAQAEPDLDSGGETSALDTESLTSSREGDSRALESSNADSTAPAAITVTGDAAEAPPSSSDAAAAATPTKAAASAAAGAADSDDTADPRRPAYLVETEKIEFFHSPDPKTPTPRGTAAAPVSTGSFHESPSPRRVSPRSKGRSPVVSAGSSDTGFAPDVVSGAGSGSGAGTGAGAQQSQSLAGADVESADFTTTRGPDDRKRLRSRLTETDTVTLFDMMPGDAVDTGGDNDDDDDGGGAAHKAGGVKVGNEVRAALSAFVPAPVTGDPFGYRDPASAVRGSKSSGSGDRADDAGFQGRVRFADATKADTPDDSAFGRRVTTRAEEQAAEEAAKAVEARRQAAEDEAAASRRSWELVTDLERRLGDKVEEVRGLKSLVKSIEESNTLLRRQLRAAEGEAAEYAKQATARGGDTAAAGATVEPAAMAESAREILLLNRRIEVLEAQVEARDARIRVLSGVDPGKPFGADDSGILSALGAAGGGRRTTRVGDDHAGGGSGVKDATSRQQGLSEFDVQAVVMRNKLLEQELASLKARSRTLETQSLSRDVELRRANRELRLASTYSGSVAKLMRGSKPITGADDDTAPRDNPGAGSGDELYVGSSAAEDVGPAVAAARFASSFADRVALADTDMFAANLFALPGERARRVWGAEQDKSVVGDTFREITAQAEARAAAEAATASEAAAEGAAVRESDSRGVGGRGGGGGGATATTTAPGTRGVDASTLTSSRAVRWGSDDYREISAGSSGDSGTDSGAGAAPVSSDSGGEGQASRGTGAPPRFGDVYRAGAMDTERGLWLRSVARGFAGEGNPFESRSPPRGGAFSAGPAGDSGIRYGPLKTNPSPRKAAAGGAAGGGGASPPHADAAPRPVPVPEAGGVSDSSSDFAPRETDAERVARNRRDAAAAGGLPGPGLPSSVLGYNSGSRILGGGREAGAGGGVAGRVAAGTAGGSRGFVYAGALSYPGDGDGGSDGGASGAAPRRRHQGPRAGAWGASLALDDVGGSSSGAAATASGAASRPQRTRSGLSAAYVHVDD